MSSSVRFLLALILTLAVSSPSQAEVGIIVLEPVGPLGFFTRVGHVGTYFSNICPDGSPIRMRLCAPGERGGVVSKYSPLSEYEDYDWAIVPFEEYMHGFESPELTPMIGTRKLQHAIEQSTFGRIFSSALKSSTDGELPDGQWRAALATRFDRSLYIYSVETSPADDAILVATFNAAPNKSRFNFFYRNCSNQAKAILDLILPHTDAIGDRRTGLTMETPKGLAKSLVARGLEEPGLHMRGRRYPQIPGTFPRSRDVLFPMENTYKSIAFAPWWFFGGFRFVALGAMFYHQVMSPFGMLESTSDFMSPLAAELTLEQHRLRQRQDEVRHALTTASGRDSRRLELSALDVRVSRRLGEIREEKRNEVSRVMGTAARWRELERGFQPVLRSLGQRLPVPVLRQHLSKGGPGGSLAEHLFEYFEAEGDFYVDDAVGGPWLSLPLAGGDRVATGLSRSHVMKGDPRLAALVLAGVIDYNLHQSEARRADVEYVEWALTQLRQVTDAVGHEVHTRE